MSIKENVHVIYHDSCADGAAAAAVMLMFFKKATLHPAQYGSPIPAEVFGEEKIVFIVDFSYPRKELLDLKSRVQHLTVIDHHKTAEEQLTGLPFCLFDANESGATLTWKKMFPLQEMPKLLEYIRDRDLWRWEMEKSREFSAGWKAYGGLSPTRVQGALLGNHGSLSSVVEKCINNGEVLLKYEKSLVSAKINKPAAFVYIGGHYVPCINATALISETCGALAKSHLFAAVYFDVFEDGKHKRVYSLRSDNTSETSLDVSAVASKYGGGGHKHAAGFSLELASAHAALEGTKDFNL